MTFHMHQKCSDSHCWETFHDLFFRKHNFLKKKINDDVVDLFVVVLLPVDDQTSSHSHSTGSIISCSTSKLLNTISLA